MANFHNGIKYDSATGKLFNPVYFSNIWNFGILFLLLCPLGQKLHIDKNESRSAAYRLKIMCP